MYISYLLKDEDPPVCIPTINCVSYTLIHKSLRV